MDWLASGGMMRMLYRIYRMQSGLRFFLMRRIRPLGWGLLIALLVGAVMMMGSPMRPLYQMFALLLGVVSVAMLWAWARKGRLRVRRELAGHATAGVALSYTLVIENMGKNLLMVRVGETMPDPRPSREEFLMAREPDEKTRNFFDRAFAFYRWQWLMDKRLLFRAKESEIFSLRAGEMKTMSMQLMPRRRGMLELDDVRLFLPDPFGLFQRARKTACAKDRVCVMPTRYVVPAFRMPGNPQYQVGEDATSRQSGSSGDFMSLRDYRSGDSSRMMHWASWAKTGKPIIKEVEDVMFSRYALVLDTFGDAGAEERFEDVVTVAASFVSTIDTEECMLDLMFMGDREAAISAGRGLAPSIVLLEALASVRMGYAERFASLSKMILSHRDGVTRCICVFNGWSLSREDFMRALVAAGIPCRAFAVVEDPENFPSRVDVDFLKVGAIKDSLSVIR